MAVTMFPAFLLFIYHLDYAFAVVQHVNVAIVPRPIQRVDPRFVSFNFDWHLAAEGENWGHNGILHLNLNQPDLLFLAKALAPAYLRIGGSQEDFAWYDVPGAGQPKFPTNATFTLTASRWEQLNKFALDAGVSIAFGLAPENGRPEKPYTTAWDASNAEAFIKYTSGMVARNASATVAYEMGNELCPSYKSPALAASDVATLRHIINRYGIAADHGRPLLVAPDCNFDGVFFHEYLQNSSVIGPAGVDVFTWHVYAGYGLDPHLVEELLEPSYLDVVREHGSVVEGLAAAAEPAHQRPIAVWAGETAAAWHSGRDGVTNAFIDGFWYMDELGSLAVLGHSAVCRQTLVGGYYELINTIPNREVPVFTPNVDFYTALLWKRVMGTSVLNVTVTSAHPTRSQSYLTVFAHCAASGRGVTFAFLNKHRNDSFAMHLPDSPSGFTLYLMTPGAKGLTGGVGKLNGRDLYYKPGSMELPNLSGETVSGSIVEVPPTSYGFVQVPSLRCDAVDIP